MPPESSTATTAPSNRPKKLLFVNKHGGSASLSRSEGSERIRIFETAQRASRKSTKSHGAQRMQKQSASHRLDGPSIPEQETATEATSIDLFQAMPAIPPQTAAHRAQLIARFFESCYPQGMPRQAEVLSKLNEWMSPRRGAALAAADCMILLHAAKETGYEPFHQDGMRRYSVALQLLSNELRTPEAAYDDSVLGAVDMMGVVETRLLRSVVGDDTVASYAHIRGLCALVLARGPSVLRSNVGKNILLQHLHEPLMVSLLSRKSSAFGEPDWQAAFQTMERHGNGNSAGKIHQLTALGYRIPQVLEKADAIINDNSSTNSQYTDLLAELTLLETRFLNWLLSRYRDFSSNGQPYWTTTATLSTLFFEQLAALRNSYPFSVVAEYDCLMDVLAHLNYCGLLLMLRTTILDVILAFESANSSSILLERTSHGARAKCDELADLICQSAHYIDGLPKHQSMIAKQGMSAFLILAVLPWYSYIQDVEKAKWCTILLQTFKKDHVEMDLVETVQHT